MPDSPLRERLVALDFPAVLQTQRLGDDGFTAPPPLYWIIPLSVASFVIFCLGVSHYRRRARIQVQYPSPIRLESGLSPKTNDPPPAYAPNPPPVSHTAVHHHYTTTTHAAYNK